MAKKLTVKNIFETMDYGTVEENFDLVQSWLERTNLQLPNTIEDIEKVIQKNEKQAKIWANVKPLEKSKLINKLAAEIDKHSILLCQLELKARQILTKDTKNKTIPISIDYLKYYASWTHSIDKHFIDYKPYGVCSCYLSPNTSLNIFCAILAPALATGNTIIFAVSSIFIPIACLISELCKNIGFADGVISFIETSTPEIFLTHERIKKVTYIGNLFDKIFSEFIIPHEKNLSTLHLGKSASIVFDSSDLDSACDTIIDATWSCRGTFPCGINQIYVQETVFNDFISKIKAKINKLNVGYPNDYNNKTCDVIIKNEIFNDNNLIEIINKLPLQIGYKNFGNDIIFDKSNNDILSIIAFRTANEAVNLANNTKYGLAISIWSENISLINEITTKLKFGIIWVNNHGNINANASFSPFKSSGNSYFGGKEGLLEYLTTSQLIDYKATPLKIPSNVSHLPNQVKKRTLIYYGGGFRTSESGLTDLDNEYPNKKDVRNCVELAKKSYETWSKTQPKLRNQILSKLAELSATIKIKNSNIVDKWIEYLYDWANMVNCTETFSQNNPNLNVIKESKGIIVIELYNDPNFNCFKFIISAIAYGNSVIIINCSDDIQEFLENVCRIISSSGLPPAIFNVFFNPNIDIINTLINHREVQSYLISLRANKEIKHNYMYKQMLRMQTVDDINCFDSFSILNLVTKNKCICTATGQSVL